MQVPDWIIIGHEATARGAGGIIGAGRVGGHAIDKIHY
jgi:hypothetical protein